MSITESQTKVVSKVRPASCKLQRLLLSAGCAHQHVGLQVGTAEERPLEGRTTDTALAAGRAQRHLIDAVSKPLHC